MKNKVLHLVPSFHQGGSEQQALQLVELLLRDGSFEVQLACLDGTGILARKAGEMGFEQVPEFPLTSFYDRNMAEQTRRFVSHLRERKVEVIQTHDFYTNIFGMLAGKLAGVPVRIAAKRETGMRSPLQKFVERRAFGAANAIIINSASVRDELVAAGVPGKKVEIVHNGIDLSRFEINSPDQSTIRGEFGLPEDPRLRFVTMIANFRERVKNQAMFIRAAEIVGKTVDNAAFVMAGEGPLLDDARAYAAKLGVADRTFFTGRCMKIPELLSISDICVLTSESEGFSNSILEYMAAGKPIVATNVGGAAEAIVHGETGYLIESNDHRSLAEMLCELIEDEPGSAELGRNGRDRVKRCFSTDVRLRKTVGIYRRELSIAGKGVAACG